MKSRKFKMKSTALSQQRTANDNIPITEIEGLIIFLKYLEILNEITPGISPLKKFVKLRNC